MKLCYPSLSPSSCCDRKSERDKFSHHFVFISSICGTIHEHLQRRGRWKSTEILKISGCPWTPQRPLSRPLDLTLWDSLASDTRTRNFSMTQLPGIDKSSTDQTPNCPTASGSWHFKTNNSCLKFNWCTSHLWAKASSRCNLSYMGSTRGKLLCNSPVAEFQIGSICCTLKIVPVSKAWPR